MKKQFQKALVILGGRATGKTRLSFHIASMFPENEVRRFQNCKPRSISMSYLNFDVCRLVIFEDVYNPKHVIDTWTLIVENFSCLNRPIPSVIFISCGISPYDLPEEHFDFVEVINPYLRNKFPNDQLTESVTKNPSGHE